MKFSTFAEYLQKLDKTTKRLEMTSLLTDLIKELDADETAEAIYLASGYLKAPFESQKFNIAEKMMQRILLHTYGSVKNGLEQEEVNQMYRGLGDLGTVAENLAKKTKQKSSQKENLSVMDVHKKLIDLAQVEGTGSQDLKVTKASNLLKLLDPLSTKYTVRIILGTTRLGFTELTIIEALSNYVAGDKSLKKEIESRYNIYPDIGLIAENIKKDGIKGINDINIEPGVPVLSQKAQRSGGPEEIMERIKKAWAEFKFDGTRVQLHMNKNKKIKSNIDAQNNLFGSKDSGYLVQTFTRNLEETTHQYPDLVSAAKTQINADSIVLDGEAIGYDPKTGKHLPFQETMQRKRKHGVTDTAKEIPLKYYVFDILYLNGKSLIQEPLRKRREVLDKAIKAGETIIVDDHIETQDTEKLQEYFAQAEEKELEGLIVKKPEDPYQAGARSYSWIKYKKADKNLLDDSVDCVVLGYYAGRGARAGFGIGGFLVGVYDKKSDSYKTISKVGTGLKDDDWVKLKEMADKVKIDKKPANVDMHKNFDPDVYVKPEIVVEIGADELSVSPTHTAGYALRFPRLLKFRKDKSPTEATTTKEIEKMYNGQRK
jgi:DNA ligase-1